MASSAAKKVPSWFVPFKKWVYNSSGFNKYGLMHDDCLYEYDDVKEALRRLPDPIKQARNFRIIRAMQLAIQHDVLPKEQWTKFEDDVKYLKPYLDEVRRERAEQAAWNREH